MKIAQINPGHMSIPPDSWGAVEKIIWYYKIHSENKGHEVHIRYINEISRGEFDIVHVHMWNHALELYEKRIPYIFTCHDHHAYALGKSSDVYRNNLLAMKQSELSIVPASYLVDYFEGIPTYLRHGIDPTEFYPGQTSDSLKLLIVGNNGMGGDSTFDRKGFRYAIEAAEKLDMPITVVGPSDCNKQFFEYHSDLLKSNVTLLYDLNDMRLQEVYREHGILIHASAVEAGHPPLTLLEAAASGLPIITTNCAGDLYTTQTERNTDDVVSSIKDVIKMYQLNRSKTIKSVEQFFWSNVVDDLIKLYDDLMTGKTMRRSILKVYNTVSKNDAQNHVFINFVDGPSIEIKGQYKDEYNVKFIDDSSGNIIYETIIRNNNWAKCNLKYKINWKIILTTSIGEVIEYKYNAENKRVLITFESSSLGDTLAWMPYVDEFRKRNNCEVIVSTFMNELFRDQYPHLKFIEPGEVVDNLYALYRIGWFYDTNGIDFSKHRNDFRKMPLQQTITDILGIEYTEIKPKITRLESFKAKQPYICIATHSTSQAKYWNNPTGWQETVDYIKSLGYDVYLLSKEPDGYMGNKNPTGVIKVENKSISEIGSILAGSKGFVGIGSGLSWYAWSLGVPTVLISGFSEPYQEMKSVHRVINTEACHGCFAKYLFDKSDWNWCPEHKKTERQFECTKSITFDFIRPSLNEIL